MGWMPQPKDHIYNKIIVEGKKKKVEINNNIIIVEDFNTPLIPMDRSTQQKINKETTNFKWYNRPVRPNWYL